MKINGFFCIILNKKKTYYINELFLKYKTTLKCDVFHKTAMMWSIERVSSCSMEKNIAT